MSSHYEDLEWQRKSSERRTFINRLDCMLQGYVTKGSSHRVSHSHLIILRDPEVANTALEVVVNIDRIATLDEGPWGQFEPAHDKIQSVEVSKGSISPYSLVENAEPVLRVILSQRQVYLPNEMGAMTEIFPETESWDEAKIVLSTLESRLAERQLAS